MSYVFFAFAFLVWLVLRLGFTPDNSPPAKMRRVLAAIPGFTPDHQIEDAHKTRILALDVSSRRMALCVANQKAQVIPFHDLIAVEIERDGITIEKTARGSQALGAAVGGALLGPAGLIVGGLSGKKTQTKSDTRLVLKLIVNDLLNPLIDMVLLDAKAAGPAGARPEVQLAEWYGRLRVILHQREHGGAPSHPEPEQHLSTTIPSKGFGRRRGLVAEG